MANTLGFQGSVGNTFTDPGIFYDKKWLERLKNNLRFEDCGQKRPLPKNSGTQVTFARVNKLTAVGTIPTASSYLLTENTNPSESTLGTTQVTAIPKTYGQWAKVSKELQWKSINPVMEEFNDELADNAAAVHSSVISTALSGNFTNQFANGAANEAAVANADVLLASELRKAVYTLRKAGVPGFEGDMYKALVSHAGVFDLQGDTAAGSWIELSKYTDTKNAMRGEIGSLYGTRIVAGHNIGTGTGATHGTFHAYVFGSKAFGITELSGQGMETIRKEPGPSDTSNPLNMFSTVGWKFVMAAKVLEASRAIQIYHGSGVAVAN